MQDHVKGHAIDLFLSMMPTQWAIPWRTFPNSPHYVHLIKPWMQSPQLLSSTSVPSPQSNALSCQGTLPLLCQLTTHPQWPKLSLEPPTQVDVNFTVLMTWQVSYSYFSLQILYMFDKLVVKIHLHIASSWKVVWGRFQPHGNKGVSKCGVISECKWLQVHYQLFLWWK